MIIICQNSSALYSLFLQFFYRFPYIVQVFCVCFTLINLSFRGYLPWCFLEMEQKAYLEKGQLHLSLKILFFFMISYNLSTCCLSISYSKALHVIEITDAIHFISHLPMQPVMY